MDNSLSPKDECEKFLARQKPWVQAVLIGEHRSPDILSALAKPGGIEELQKAQDEYEELLKRCPKLMREYRRRATESAKQAVLLHLGPVTPGRPPNQNAQEQGRKAARLRNQGKTWGEIARRWCARKSESKHVCNKLCADRIRHNAAPYLRQK